MERSTATKRRAPAWLVALITAVVTAVVLFGLLAALLGVEGLSVMQGWLLARYAFVEEDADLGTASDSALRGMVSGLGDRWSYYVTPANYENLMNSRANRYQGIGVTINYTDERGLTVISVTEGGPADLGGLTVGDIITAVDGQDLSGDNRYNGTELIAGEVGEERVLTVLSPGGGTREVTLVLDYLEVRVVTGELLDNGMGLVTIANFNTNAHDEFRETVDELVAQGATALLFDVRNDGGGYVRELTRMLDYLLPEGDVFQSNPRWGVSSVSRSDEACIGLPFGVLVNTESYSAAELFAAQLRESAGAPIVGEHTSGKGYSQNTFPLLNGGALGISTARYCTGSGVSLIGVGITPDIELSLDEEQAAMLNAGTLAPEDDPQVQALIGLMEKN